MFSLTVRVPFWGTGFFLSHGHLWVITPGVAHFTWPIEHLGLRPNRPRSLGRPSGLGRLEARSPKLAKASVRPAGGFGRGAERGGEAFLV